MEALTATISEKGQITIPKAVRDRLGLRPGDKIDFVHERSRVTIRERLDRDPIAALYGSLRLPASVDESIDEMRGPADL